ncbi:DUF6301 family protein [Nocardia sp. NPDC004068]|uniref:DUF6301 family protein n=1 Tax=Nocardia sp. NPDC004068 TaxID=3364303 RepID=UPI003686B41A
MAEWRRLGNREIVELATRLRAFDWSWKLADVPALARAFGWQVRTTRPDWVLLDTGFGVGSGRVHGRSGNVQGIEVQVTDYAQRQEQVRDAFADMTGALSVALGNPTARMPGESAEVRWADGEDTVQLMVVANTLQMHLARNSYLAARDRAIELEKEGLM